MAKKPSQMPIIGKAQPKPGAKAQQAAKTFGGLTGKAVGAINQSLAARKKALKDW